MAALLGRVARALRAARVPARRRPRPARPGSSPTARLSGWPGPVTARATRGALGSDELPVLLGRAPAAAAAAPHRPGVRPVGEDHRIPGVAVHSRMVGRPDVDEPESTLDPQVVVVGRAGDLELVVGGGVVPDSGGLVGVP